MKNPIIYENGDKIWYNSNGDFHRDDGPAIELYSGGKQWYIDGQRHREDGPAAEWSGGSKAWYIKGKCIT